MLRNRDLHSTALSLIPPDIEDEVVGASEGARRPYHEEAVGTVSRPGALT
jgi:hypothetical protein